MSKIIEVVTKLIELTANFSNLKEQVLRIEHRVNDHAERIIRLESSKEVAMEQARSSAVAGITKLEAHLIERIVRIEESQKRLPPPSPQITEKSE